MNKKQKITFLVNNYYPTWYETRRKVEDELSAKQLIICVCGRLATGMHEAHCRKFRELVDSETLKRLEYLKVFPKEADPDAKP